jgi:hypothetical protein
MCYGCVPEDAQSSKPDKSHHSDTARHDKVIARIDDYLQGCFSEKSVPVNKALLPTGLAKAIRCLLWREREQIALHNRISAVSSGLA